MHAESKSQRISIKNSFFPFLKDIKIQHSIFALPFAFVAFAVSDLPSPTLGQVGLLLVCMVCARSFAMGMNRYLDKEIDQENPRTSGRMIPSGQLPASHGLAYCIFFAVFFVGAAFMFNMSTGLLSIPLLAILAIYSFTKRWTWLCHFYLGACLGLAPIAVSVAMSGGVGLPILFVSAAMLFWTAGFDLLYSLQDLDFDKERGLRSVPAKIGKWRTVWMSRACFVLTVSFMVGAGLSFGAGPLYYLGIIVVAVLLIWEHFLILPALKKEGPVRNINVAFFNINAYVSLVFCAFAFADQVWL